MPVFDYICGVCGHQAEMLVGAKDLDLIGCPECGRRAFARQFSPTLAAYMAPWMRSESDDARARHRAWLQSDKTQAKLRSGELVPDTGPKYSGVADGPMQHSSPVDRALASGGLLQ